MSSVFKITSEKFEGPIELLLSLIKERKLPINEISLAKITDDYLRVMSEVQEQSYDETTQFMTIAATLVLIKSKSLLPILELTDEEEENIADLERRLQIYNAYREIGEQLITGYNATPLLSRSYIPKPSVFAPDPKITSDMLMVSLQGLLDEIRRFEKKSIPEQRVRSTVHLEDMVGSLIQRVQQSMQVSFKDFTCTVCDEHKADTHTHKAYLVVGFLAMLEMVRNGIIAAEQGSVYEDIMINKN